jgi:hypothetical protein
VWHTFDQGRGLDLGRGAFGLLEDIDEGRIRRGAAVSRRWEHDAEVVTYVREGGVVHEDAGGKAVVLQAGEFQRRTIGRGRRQSEKNSSRHDAAHIFHVRLRHPGACDESAPEQRRFSAAERRGVLCVVASVDGRDGSLRLNQDALMHSALLDPGQHVVHALAEGRSAWVHLVHGEVNLGGVVLRTGDGVGITSDRAVSITAREVTEILLINLIRAPDHCPVEPPPGSWKRKIGER